jgi:hypothetical protein
MTVNRFASFDIDVGGNRFTDRINEPPSIRRTAPEFFVGVQVHESSNIVIENADGYLDTLNIRRGLLVKFQEHFIDEDGNTETHTLYRGKVDKVNKGKTYELELVGADEDLLLTNFPNVKTDTTNFPSVIDSNFPVPWIPGQAFQIPLSLVEAFESGETSRYRYVVGLSDITIDNVYRGDLLLTEYTGTATGATSTTVTLPASLTKHDDFFNNLFIEMDGEVREITDYNASTRVATVATWGASAGAFTIREWKKNLITVDTFQVTEIEFAIAQRDTSDALFKRDRMSADVTRTDTTIKNPANAINDIANYITEMNVEASSLSSAVTVIDGIGDLECGGAQVDTGVLREILDELGLIGRLQLDFNDTGEITFIVDTNDGVAVWRGINDNDNVLSRDTNFNQISQSQLNKDLKIQYRRLYDSGEFRLETDTHTINATEGRGTRELPMNFLVGKTPADKVCHYLAKRYNSFDDSLGMQLGIDAREFRLGSVFEYVSDELNFNGNRQCVSEDFSNDSYSFLTIEFLASIFTYTPGTLPSDPVTDARADFRFTPPDKIGDPPTLNWEALELNTSVNAEFTITIPTENYKDVLVEYKDDAVGTWFTFGRVSGTSFTIPGLIPGHQYDFRFTSYNKFDLEGGVVELDNQVAPGDTTPPADPAGGDTPVLESRLGRIFEARTSYNIPDDFRRFEWQFRNGSTVLNDEPIYSVSPFVEFTYKGSSNITVDARFRLQDFSMFPDTWTAWSSDSNGISTALLLKDDILDGQITQKATGFSAGTITLNSNNETILEDAGITTDGEPVMIWWSYIMRMVSGVGAGSGFRFKIERNGSSITGWLNTQPIDVTTPGRYYYMTGSWIDNSPGNGFKDYDLIMDSTAVIGATAANRNITVEELRR